MATRIITKFGKQHRPVASRSRDGFIILSAAAFAIGFLLFLTMIPSPQRSGPAAEPDAMQIVSGP